MGSAGEARIGKWIWGQVRELRTRREGGHGVRVEKTGVRYE